MHTEQQRSALCCELVHHVASDFGEVRLRVTGSSMLPLVWPGDEITAKCTDPSQLRRGDIVLYRRDDGLKAHRLVKVEEGHLVTQGDSLPNADQYVLAHELVGRVIGISRNGVAVRFELSPVSRLLSIALQRSDLLRYLAQSFIRHFQKRSGRLLRGSRDMQLT